MEDNKQEEYQVYLEERKQLITAERDTAQQFDKAILTLAAGALGLSIAFINQIAPHPKPNSIYCLITAWISFCLSMLSTLISFLTSQAACRKQRDIIDKNNTKNKAASWTNWLNYFSIGFFIAGVIFLIIFSTINLPKGGEEAMGKKKVEEGYVPPKPPVKPVDSGETGFVPPKLPLKPPQKPTTGKK
jgi:magnesium-transporting ATPase (P-type)